MHPTSLRRRCRQLSRDTADSKHTHATFTHEYSHATLERITPQHVSVFKVHSHRIFYVWHGTAPSSAVLCRIRCKISFSRPFHSTTRAKHSPVDGYRRQTDLRLVTQGCAFRKRKIFKLSYCPKLRFAQRWRPPNLLRAWVVPICAKQIHYSGQRPSLQAYLLTPMDRATLSHAKSPIAHCTPGNKLSRAVFELWRVIRQKWLIFTYPTCVCRPRRGWRRSNFVVIFGVRKIESLGYRLALFASSCV